MGLAPNSFFNFSKGVYHEFWVSQIPMVLFFWHGSCQVLSKKQIKTAGEVALGWVPLVFIVFTFFFVEHTSLGFGYLWIQYLIDFGENEIQGSQACRILLGSMVGIYWIYALFGGHYCLGRKGCSQNTPQKKKKNYGFRLPDYHSASTKLEIHI